MDQSVVMDTKAVESTAKDGNNAFMTTLWDKKAPIAKCVSLESQFNKLFMQVSANMLCARPARTNTNKKAFETWGEAVRVIEAELTLDPTSNKYIDAISEHVTDNKALHTGLLNHSIEDKSWLMPFYIASGKQVDTQFILGSFDTDDDDSVHNIYDAFTGLYRISLVYGAYKHNPDLKQIIDLITSVARPNMSKQNILSSILPLIGPNSGLKKVLFNIFENQNDDYLDTLSSKLQLVLETIDPSYAELNVSKMLHQMCGTNPDTICESDDKTQSTDNHTETQNSFAEFEAAFEKFSPIMTSVLTQCAQQKNGEKGLSMQSILPMITNMMRETGV